MRHSHRNIIAALLIVPATALAADSSQLTEGRWEEKITTTAVTFDGEPIPSDKFDAPSTTFACLSPDQAKKPALYFLRPSQRHSCSTPTGTVAGGNVSMSATCTGESTGPTQLNADGQYDRDSYRLTIRANLVMQGRPLVMDSVMEGRFVGPCRGDEDN